MPENEKSVFKKKEGKIIITLFFIVVAVLSLMNAYEKYSPSILGNDKSVYEGGMCGLIVFRDKRIDKMKADIVKTDDCIYSDDDIEKAVEVVKKYYKDQKNNIGLCSLKFDENDSKTFLKNYHAVEKYGKENVIVLMCNYNVYDNDNLGAMEYGYYQNWAMILARETADSQWQIIDQGY